MLIIIMIFSTLWRTGAIRIIALQASTSEWFDSIKLGLCLNNHVTNTGAFYVNFIKLSCFSNFFSSLFCFQRCSNQEHIRQLEILFFFLISFNLNCNEAELFKMVLIKKLFDYLWKVGVINQWSTHFYNIVWKFWI